MKLSMNFTADLKDPNSKLFKETKAKVESGLAAVKKTPGVADVIVTGFRSGSVIAEFEVVMKPGEKLPEVSTLEAAVSDAIKNGDFSGLPVDKTYVGKISKFTIVLLRPHVEN